MKTSSSSDNGSSKSLTGGGEEDVKKGTGNESTYYGIGGLNGIRIRNSKDTTSTEGKGSTDDDESDANIQKSTQDVFDDTGSSVEKQESKDLHDKSAEDVSLLDDGMKSLEEEEKRYLVEDSDRALTSSSSCHQVTFETLEYIIRRDRDLDCPSDFRIQEDQCLAAGLEVTGREGIDVVNQNGFLAVGDWDDDDSAPCGCFLKKMDSNFNYGDSFYIQNNTPNRYLTGARFNGNIGAYTVNDTFPLWNGKFKIESSPNDDSMNGNCVRYGDTIYIRVMVGVDRWLMFDNDDHYAYTKNVIEPDQNSTLYEWVIRSNMSGDNDPFHGSCVATNFALYLQWNGSEDRWLAGRRWLEDYEKVFVKDKNSLEKSQYQWSFQLGGPGVWENGNFKDANLEQMQITYNRGHKCSSVVSTEGLFCKSDDFHSSGDFMVEGYLNEEGTNVIPSSCHDKPGASCTLEVCHVEKLVIEASNETTLDHWKMKAYGEGIADADTFHLISNNPSPLEICLSDTSWSVGGTSMFKGMKCDHIANDDWCGTIMALDDSVNMGKSIEEACCVCGGSKSFTTYPSLVPTNAPTVSQMPTAPTSQPTACVDDSNWYLHEGTELGCASITEDMCNRFDDYVYNEKSLKDACCVCGGGKHRSVIPSLAPTNQPSYLPTLSPTSVPSDQPSTAFSKNLEQALMCHQITLKTSSNIINKGNFVGLDQQTSGSDDSVEYWSVTGSYPKDNANNWNITLPIAENEDFATIAKLKIERITDKGSAAAFYLNEDDYFGFDGQNDNDPIFSRSEVFSRKEIPQDFVRPINKVFTFKVERKNNHIKFFIDDVLLMEGTNYGKAIKTLEWGPSRANLKIYDWTFIPSNDFTLDGYMNEEGTNVIPRSCYDTLDDSCNLDICGVDEVVVTSTVGSSRAFFSNRGRNQINTHTYISIGEKYGIGGSSTIPFAFDTPNVQPYIEILQNGNLVARAWNGKEYVTIYEAGETFECEDGKQPIALFHGNTGLVAGCSNSGVHWGKYTIAGKLEEGACAIAFLNGNLVCLSNTGDIRRTYGGDENILGIQYKDEMLVDEVTSTIKEGVSNYQCHDIELKRLTNSIGASATELNIRSRNNKGTVPDGSFDFAIDTTYYLQDSLDLRTENGDNFNPFIVFQGDFNIVVYFSGCGAIASLRTNPSDRDGNGVGCRKDYKASFTNDGRILFQCTKDYDEPYSYYYPEGENENGLNDRNEVCKLKFFDGRGVCMFPDGNIAYALTNYWWIPQKCALAKSFKIPGYTNANPSLGNSIPETCAGNGSSCHLRVCGVDTLRVPASVDVSMYTFFDESGIMHIFENNDENLNPYYEFPFGTCKDVDDWYVGGTSMYSGMTCEDFINDAWCGTIMALDDSVNMGKSIEEACCVCGGSALFTTHPSVSPTNAPTVSQMPTAPTAAPTTCENDEWFLDEKKRLGCASITEDMCNRFEGHIQNRKSAKEACCVCGGGKHRSVIPSLAPTNQPSYLPTLSPTSVPSDQPSTVFSKNLAQAKPILDTLQVLSIQVGSDLVSAYPVDDTTLFSLFGDTGFFISKNKSRSIELHGNAWKLFKLPEKYSVTSNTQLTLDIVVDDKANGHLICFAKEISEDLDFDDKNCISLIDTETEMWSNAKKAYNLALRKTATAATSFSWLGSSNAIDGLSTTFSLAQRENQGEASIELDLGESRSISRIEVSSIFGLPQSLQVKFHTETDAWSNDDGDYFIDGKVVLAKAVSARYLKITSSDNLLISNIEVIGSSDLSSITYPLAVLFDGRETEFQYIALIQDNSSDKNKGISTISNIQFSETDSIADDNQTQNYENDLEGTFFRLSHITSEKKLSIGGIKSTSNIRVAFLSNTTPFEMSQVFLLEQGGTIQSLQFPEYYLRIDDNCKIEFAKMKNEELMSFEWLLDPNNSNNIFIQCQGEFKALTVVDDMLTLGPVPSKGEQHQHWRLMMDLSEKQKTFISALKESSTCHQITLNTASNIINKGNFVGLDQQTSGSDDSVEYWSVTGSNPKDNANNWNITLPIAENEDFATIAKLKIERITDKGSAAAFYLNEDDYFGFDGQEDNDPIFSRSEVFSREIPQDFVRPINKVFTFKVERKSNHIKFFIDDVLLMEGTNYGKAIKTLEWGPSRANLKIYDWTFIPSNDFTLDGYMNEEGTNVIPRSCYDTLDDSCNLDICGVDEVVVTSTVGSSRAFFSNRGRNQINTHTYIMIGEKYGIGGSSTIPFALDTPNVQPFLEILQNGNLVARAWNGKEYVTIYEAGLRLESECRDGQQPIALFHGKKRAFISWCSDPGQSWGFQHTIAGTLEEGACAIAFLNGNLVCLSNKGEIKRTYRGDTFGIQYKDEMLVDEVSSTFEEGASTLQCHDIELKHLTNSIGASATELNIRSRNNKGSVPDGSFDFAIDTRYYLQDSNNLKPYILFQGDFNIVVYFSGCGAIASLRTNPSDRDGNGVGCRKDYKASFTNDGRILFQCTKDYNEPYSYYYPEGENENGLNDRNEVCKLKFFDGRGVCMFPDGNIAYALPGGSWNTQNCARARSFKIPGYTNANPSLGNSIPKTCAGNGSSCHLRVCGVDTLRVPSNIDVSKFEILNDSGKSLRRTWHHEDNFFEYELMSTAFGGRSVFPTTPISIQIDTYDSTGIASPSRRRLALESSNSDMSMNTLDMNRSMISVDMNDDESLVDVTSSEMKIESQVDVIQDAQLEISDGNRRLASYPTWSKNSIKPDTWIEPGVKYYIGGAGTLEPKDWTQPWIILTTNGFFEAWHEFQGSESRDTKLFRLDFRSLKNGCEGLNPAKRWGGYLQSDRHLIFACNNGRNRLDRENGWGYRIERGDNGLPTYSVGSPSCALVYLNRKVVCMGKDGTVYYEIGSGNIDRSIQFQELPYQLVKVSSQSCPTNMEIELGDCMHAVHAYSRYSLHKELSVLHETDIPTGCSFSRLFTTRARYNFGSSSITGRTRLCKKNISYNVEYRSDGISKCPQNHDIPKKQCWAAALKTNAIQYNKDLPVYQSTDNGDHCGCFLQNGKIKYRNYDSQTSCGTTGDLICKIYQISYNVEKRKDGLNTCPTGLGLPQDECWPAARKLEYQTPKPSDNCKPESGVLICKKHIITYDFELREEGLSQCPTGLKIPKEECWPAARELGLELPSNYYENDDCKLTRGLICKRQVRYDVEVRGGDSCPKGLEVSSDDCYYAALYLGLEISPSDNCPPNGNLICKQAVKYFMLNLDPLRCLGSESESESESLTMVDCEYESSTKHKWFFEIDNDEKISLWTRNESTKLCLQSNLSIVSKSNGVACDFAWKFLQNGQIQNDSNSQVIEYDSTTYTVSLQNQNDLNPNQKWFISDRYVTKQSEYLDAHFKGSYQNGIFFQDHTGFVRVQNEEVHLFGNSWKLFEFPKKEVHFRTKLLFRYKILENAEDHFICFGTNYQHQVSKETKRNCVKLGVLVDSQLNGSQLGSSYQVGLEDGWKTLSIPIFDLLKEETLTPEIDYIAFIQNNDATPLHGHSAFSEFRLSTIELGTPSFSCDVDFIAADDEGMRPTKNLNTDKDFCVGSNLKSLVSYEGNAVKIDTRGYNLNSNSLVLYEAKDSSTAVSDKTDIRNGEVLFDVATKDSAGKKFLVQNNGTNPFQFYFITKCSGEIFEDTNDLTGAPRNFVSYQEKGHVRFRFKDNSLCEDGFAFTRFDDPASREFLQKDFFDEGVTFSPIFYFSGKDHYGDDITPETEASDDLTLSRLGVGEEYGYCIRAVHRDRYMDTMALENTDNTKTSSSTCHVHKIRWESSINGKITTEPNAGTLPIKHVRIDYELMTEMQEPIECDGCSGTVYTGNGGSFDIDFNVDHPLLKGKGSTSIPVKLKYSKVTKFGQNTINHVFLCNNGLEFCDNGGNLVYLKHLHFEEPVHIYDDTSVPFRGKLFYHNTRFPGSEGVQL